MYAAYFTSGETEALKALSLAEGRTLGNDLKAMLLPWPVVPPADYTVEAEA